MVCARSACQSGSSANMAQVYVQGSTDVTRQNFTQAGRSSKRLPPDAAEISIDTMPCISTAMQHQAPLSAPQHTAMAAAAISKPDGDEGKGSAEGGSSSCNADSACLHELGIHAWAAGQSHAAAMPGTAVRIPSAAFDGVAVSGGSKPAASLTVAAWSQAHLTLKAALLLLPATRLLATASLCVLCPSPTQASTLGITPFDICSYTVGASNADHSLSSSVLALPRISNIYDATAAGMPGHSFTGHADFSHGYNHLPKVPQLSQSALHTQPIACSNSAAGLQDSPRPGLQQPPCIHHPPGSAAPTLGTPCWPDSTRPASQPSLALPLSLQDAALLPRPAVGLGSAPDNINLPHSPRLSLLQSTHAVFQTTSAGNTSPDAGATCGVASRLLKASMLPSGQGASMWLALSSVEVCNGTHRQ